MAAAIIGGVYIVVPYVNATLATPQVRTTSVRRIGTEGESIKLVASGFAVPRTHALVAAKQQNRVASVLVREGQAVKAGETVALLDASDARAAASEASAAVSTAKARLNGAIASLQDAKVRFRREQDLSRTGSTTQAALEDARSRYQTAVAAHGAAAAEVASARARAERMRLQVGDMQVTAPISGTVTRVFARPGEMTNTEGLVEIIDLSSLLVETDVAENKIDMVEVGGPVELTFDALTTRRYRGQVAEVRRTVDRHKATVLVRIAFVDSPEKVLPQMAAKAAFLSKPIDPARLNQMPRLAVAASAVVQHAGAPAVFTLEDGKARLVAVSVGEANDDGSVTLKTGPSVGTTVILDPPPALKDGDAVVTD